MSILALFIGFWLLMCLAAARLSGWHALAKQYPLQTNLSDDSKHFNTLHLGCLRYCYCVRLSKCADQLQLQLWAPFRLGHPPLSIPLAQLNSQRVSGRFGDYVMVTMDQLTLKLKPAVAAKLLA